MSEPLDIEELERLEAMATPGPWDVVPSSFDESDASVTFDGRTPAVVVVKPLGNDEFYATAPEVMATRNDADAAFIAASRSAVPALILERKADKARITELEATLAKARDEALEAAGVACDEKRDNGLNANLQVDVVLWVDGYEHGCRDCAVAVRALKSRTPT